MAKATSGRGRPGKLTPEIQDKIVAAIRAGNYATIAAEYAGISESTFYRWLRQGRETTRGQYRDFYLAVQKAEREAEVRAVAILQKHMDDNWSAAMTFLERKFPERWGRRDRLRVEIDPREVLSEMLALGDDELEAFIDQTARQP